MNEAWDDEFKQDLGAIGTWLFCYASCYFYTSHRNLIMSIGAKTCSPERAQWRISESVDALTAQNTAAMLSQWQQI